MTWCNSSVGLDEHIDISQDHRMDPLDLKALRSHPNPHQAKARKEEGPD